MVTLPSAVLVVALSSATACSNDEERAASSNEVVAELVADLTDGTSVAGSVDGLFGLALSPAGDRLVIMRSVPDGEVRVESFPYQVGKGFAPDSGRVIMALPHPYIHNGGGLAMMPNGDLLVSVMADVGVIDTTSTPLQVPDGVILRIPARFVTDPNAGPYVPAAEDVIARGLRNPFRIALDAKTGDLWIGDNGEEKVEEIDRIPGADVGRVVHNFGWPYFEASLENISVPAGAEFTAPVIEYQHSDGKCSVLGGLTYRSQRLADLDGAYVFGDYCGPTIRALTGSPDDPTVIDIGTAPSSPTKFVTDENGRMYVLAGDDRVYQVTSGSKSTADRPAVDVTLLATLYPQSRQPGPRHESADMIVGPGGNELLVAERSGIIGRIRLKSGRAAAGAGAKMETALRDIRPADVDPAICKLARNVQVNGFEFPDPDDVRSTLETAQDAAEQLAPALPTELKSDMSNVRQALDSLVSSGKSANWDIDDPEFRDAVRAVADERGTYAKAYRSAQMITNYLAGCNSSDNS